MQTIRVLIVDDEPIARRGIRRAVEGYPDAEIVGECAHGREAVATIRRQQPDLVFLDIQIPECSGFEVVAEVGVERMPTVIFVTAYDQYALQAFEAHALDYVLKPIDKSRLQHAYERAADRIRRDKTAMLQQRLNAVLSQMQHPQPPPPKPALLERVVIREGGRIFFLDTQDIAWVEAAGNYVQLHVKGQKHLLRETMRGLANKLPSRQFVRISRSLIVNIRHVREFHVRHKGSYHLLLHDGTQLTSSRHYRTHLEKHFRF